MKKYALLSTWDKSGLLPFAKKLNELGYHLIATGRTASFLKDNGINCTEVIDVTHFPEILEGRVKTLHPYVFGGILARSWVEEDIKTLENYGIPRIEIVVVNFYPFEKKKKEIKDLTRLLEYIDIGGPSLVRAAAKNFKDVVVITDPEDYELIIRELEREGSVSMERRKKLAIKAFQRTAQYDALISEHLQSFLETRNPFPKLMILPLEKEQNLRYGENPHQKASMYRHSGSENDIPFELLLGKELSYNNIVDMYSAYQLVREFKDPACVIVKHTNPTGASVDFSLIEAYTNALSTDSQAAFGGIVAFNDTVDEELARMLNERFYEVIIAPDYTEDALSKLKIKKNRRVVRAPYLSKTRFEIKNVFNRYLVQEHDDIPILDPDNMKVVPEGKTVDTLVMEDLEFAFTVVKYVKSNGIVVARDKRTLGIGAGQMSRVKSVSLALRQAGTEAEGAVLASDGFFPFPDSIELAARYGIIAIIQPGGSIRDPEVIEAAEKAGITMVLTGIRHFRH